MGFKIQDTATKKFSHGAVKRTWSDDPNRLYTVQFSRNGKTWTDPALVKAHLLKCLVKGINIQQWEVVEIKIHPTNPIMEWVDANMFMKVLKNA